MPEDQVDRPVGRSAGLGDAAAIQEASGHRQGAFGRYVGQTMPSSHAGRPVQGAGPAGARLQAQVLEKPDQPAQGPLLSDVGPGKWTSRIARTGRTGQGGLMPFYERGSRSRGGSRAGSVHISIVARSGESRRDGFSPRSTSSRSTSDRPVLWRPGPPSFDPGGRHRGSWSVAGGHRRPGTGGGGPSAQGRPWRVYATEASGKSGMRPTAARPPSSWSKRWTRAGVGETALSRCRRPHGPGRSGSERAGGQESTKGETQKGKVAEQKAVRSCGSLRCGRAADFGTRTPGGRSAGRLWPGAVRTRSSCWRRCRWRGPGRRRPRPRAWRPRRPTVVDGVPYTWQLEGPTGNTVLRVAPGFDVKEKPWWTSSPRPRWPPSPTTPPRRPRCARKRGPRWRTWPRQKKAGASSTNIHMPGAERSGGPRCRRPGGGGSHHGRLKSRRKTSAGRSG